MSKSALLLVCLVLAVFIASAGTALAAPPESIDETPMVDGRVRTITQTGNNIWVGGTFTQVEQRDGSVIANVSNVAVFDSATGEYVDIAPKLGDEGSTVWDMEIYGDDVVIAGDFAGSSTEGGNLVLVDGTTGAVLRWYDSEVVRSALAAPELGRIYGGGQSLTAFDVATGEKLWTRAKTTIDASIRSYGLGAGYRDLELDANGQTIWAACGCDAVVAPDGTSNPAKALVKLDTEGNHDTSWLTQAAPEAYGMSLVVAKSSADFNSELYNGRSLYLAAGGNDFLAAYPKGGGGESTWIRDTSGAAQVVEKMHGKLVVGGHFWEVADQADDDCGHRSPDNNDLMLDPNDECQTRKGLAAYSFDGVLDPMWVPEFSGKYSLVWALHPEPSPQGTRLHVGGEFLTVDGVTQNYYARLSYQHDGEEEGQPPEPQP
jgi:hypothetical protein